MAAVRSAQLDWHAASKKARAALADALARHEAARGELTRAVRLFRWVFTMQQPRKSSGVLPRAWHVHRALQRVRRAEATLRALGFEPIHDSSNA